VKFCVGIFQKFSGIVDGSIVYRPKISRKSRTQEKYQGQIL